MSFRHGHRAGDRHTENSTHSNIFGTTNGHSAKQDQFSTRSLESYEEREQRPARKSSGRKAPQGVPRLALDSMIDKDDDVVKEMNGVNGKKPPPVTVSVVSPSRQPRKRSGELSSGRPKKHDFVPNLELDLSASSDALQAMKAAAEDVYRDISIEYADDMTHATQIQVQQHIGRQRKEQIVEEQLLADQLNGMSVSTHSNSHGPVQTAKHSAYSQKNSVVSGKDHDLSKRLRFGARILTHNDRDALREISGFFFAGDSSLTLYEFRQFGTRSSALPFIARGAYHHANGLKAGQPICILDISVGNVLSFDTTRQSTLPETLRQEPSIRFVVTDLDESAKDALMYYGCSSNKEKAARSDWIEKYTTADEHKQRVFLRDIQQANQMLLSKRIAVKTLIGLRKHLYGLDKSGKGIVTQTQLMSALRKFRLDISPEDLSRLNSIAKNDGSKENSVFYFLRYFFGEMHEARRAAAKRAFVKMDNSKCGTVRSTELGRFYLARNHPAVVSKKKTETEERRSLLSLFSDTQISGEVRFTEFIDYCEAISLTLPNHDKFFSFMQRMWGV